MNYRGAARLLLEAFGALAALSVIALLILFWRLTSGPVAVDFLAPYIEEAFQSEGISVEIGSTALIWNGSGREIQVEARDWRLRDRESQLLAYLPRAELSLSLEALARGRFAATKLELDRARLQLLRDEEGRLAFVQSWEEEDAAPDVSSVAEEVLAQLLAPADPDKPVSYLQQVDVRDARILLDDQRVGRRVEVTGASLLIWRGDGELRGRLEGLAGLDQAGAGLTASFRYGPEAKLVEAQLHFRDLYLADLAPWSDVPALAGIGLVVEGSAELDLPVDGRLPAGSFALQGRDGNINLPMIFAQPFDILSLSLEGSFDAAAGHLDLPAVHLQLGDESDPGPRLNIAAALRNRDGAVDLAVEAQAKDVLTSDLQFYWPTILQDGGRPWVIENIRAGSAPEGRVRAQLTIPRAAGAEPLLHELEGSFTFRDLEVHYLRPLPPVSGLHGHATFDAEGFQFDVEGGGMGALAITRGAVGISGLQLEDQHLRVEFDAHSPLPLILGILEHPRLDLLQGVGLRAAGSGGLVEAKASFGLPLEEDVALDDIEIAVEATIQDVILPAMVLGQDLTGGPLSLDLTQEAMRIDGTVFIGGIEARNVIWRESFSGGPGSMRVSADIPQLTEEDRKRLDIDLGPYLGGILSGSIDLVAGEQARASLDLALDLQRATLQLQEIDWTKGAGTPGTLEGRLMLQNERLLSLEDFQLQAGSLSLSDGYIAFDAQSDPRDMQFASAFFEGNEIQQLSIRRLPGGGTEVHIGGGRLDLEPLLKDEETPGEERIVEAAEESTGLLRVFAPHLSELRFAENRFLRAVELRLEKQGDLWQEVQLRGEVPRHLWRYRNPYDEADDHTVRKGVSLLYGKAADQPGYALNLDADDLGALLRALDLFDMIEGGELRIVGSSAAPLPSAPMSFDVWAADYSLLDAPVMARLLTIASLSGLGNLLAGEGIFFQRLVGEVAWSDERLSSELVRAYGPSLGITARGHLDLEGDASDVRGTLVPAYSINQVLGAIPLLGFLLTGGEGEGVLGVTYALSGSLSEPHFSVNPLSVLTPGFLRGLFNLPAGSGETEPPSVFPSEEMRGP